MTTSAVRSATVVAGSVGGLRLVYPPRPALLRFVALVVIVRTAVRICPTVRPARLAMEDGSSGWRLNPAVSSPVLSSVNGTRLPRYRSPRH
jgi:hypothetical protein